MKHFTAQDISLLEKIYRINLINSCTGYKSANLIATQAENGTTNVAIFNSVVHLGSNPPLLGFVLRPTTVPRHTFENMKNTGVFTVNHISKNSIKDAHHTSASYDKVISEFDKTTLEAFYKEDFKAPYVSGAAIQMGCEYINHYTIEENGCLFIIGAIKHLYVAEHALEEDGFISLEKAETVAISGLDGYSFPELLDRFEYARPKK